MRAAAVAFAALAARACAPPASPETGSLSSPDARAEAVVVVTAPPGCVYLEGTRGSSLRTTCADPADLEAVAADVQTRRGDASPPSRCTGVAAICASPEELFDAIVRLEERRDRALRR